jgi:hypothetical protein
MTAWWPVRLPSQTLKKAWNGMSATSTTKPSPIPRRNLDGEII